MAAQILIASANAIDFEHERLAAQAETLVSAPVAVWRPLTFVEHSGFTETVREEIALVLANQPASEAPLRGPADFIAWWGFEPWLDRRVLDLSGGWRKYLGLALFLNRPVPARLLFDVTSHLSDARLRTILVACNDAVPTMFCEYDAEILRGLAPALACVRDDGTRIAVGAAP